MRTKADAATLLARALVVDAARHGLRVTVAETRTRSWASATFTGQQVSVELTCVDGSDLTCWAESIGGSEPTVRGHFVADLTVRVVGAGVMMIDALALADW